MRKLLPLLLATVVVGLLATTGPAAAGLPGPDAAQRSSDAVPGHYSGRDAHDNHIRFDFEHGRMKHFRINHEGNGHAHVGHFGKLLGWSMNCDDEPGEFCSHGFWMTSHQVRGGWTQGDNPHSTHFTAHWIGEISE